MSIRIYLLVLLLLTGCSGPAPQESAAAPAPVSLRVEGLTVELRPGWNAVAFTCSRLTALSVGEGVRGALVMTENGYQPAALTPALNARLGYWVYAAQAGRLTYSGEDDGEFVELRTGWNLVSFCRAEPLAVSRLTPAVPALYQVEAEGTSRALGPQDTLAPGRPCWIYAAQAGRLTWPEPAVSVAALSLTPAAASVARYGTTALQARATLTGGEVRDVTAQAVWSSAEPSVAASLSGGLYKGLNPGQTVVTASYAGATANATLTVSDLAAPPAPFPSPSPARLLVSNTVVPSTINGTVTGYTGLATLTGNQAPVFTVNSSFAGNLVFPRFMAVDTTRNELYVAQQTNPRGVGVFSLSTTPPTPTRFLSVTVGAPKGVAYDAQADRLFVSTEVAPTVLVYDGASALNGAPVPNRQITGLAGSAPDGLAYDRANDRLYVSMFTNGYLEVIDNASTANGVAASVVSRRITLSPTGFPRQLQLDSAGRLYVACALGVNGGVRVYNNPGGLNGTVAADRQINNAIGCMGLALDETTDELFVSLSMTPRVEIYANASTASGTPTPARSLQGAATGLANPHGLLILR